MIQRNIAYAQDSGVHVEISVPMVVRDDLGTGVEDYFGIWDLVRKNTPIHLLKVFPANRFDGQSTPDEALFSMRKLLLSKMQFIYIENVFTDEGQNTRETHCPSCNKLLIRRVALQPEIFIDNRCPECNKVYVSNPA